MKTWIVLVFKEGKCNAGTALSMCMGYKIAYYSIKNQHLFDIQIFEVWGMFYKYKYIYKLFI